MNELTHIDSQSRHTIFQKPLEIELIHKLRSADEKTRRKKIMGMLKSFIKAVESMGEESADEKLEKSTEELLNSLHSDPNNSENRKKAAGLVISTMYTGYYGDAADNASKFAGIYGEEFSYLYVPVCNMLRAVDNYTINPEHFRHADNKICNQIIAMASKMENVKVDPQIITDFVAAIVNFIEGKFEKYDESIRKEHGKGSDEWAKLRHYIEDACSSIFLYKTVAETIGAYEKFGSHFSVGLGLKDKDFAIPGPVKASTFSKYSFMKSVAELEDAESLLSIYALICNYEKDKRNKVSVFSGSCKAKISLDGKPFLGKSCKMLFKFSGKKKRKFEIAGKLNAKKLPALLEKANEFKLWKKVEEKPVLAVSIKLQDAEFFEKVSGIPEITKSIDEENAAIKEILNSK